MKVEGYVNYKSFIRRTYAQPEVVQRARSAGPAGGVLRTAKYQNARKGVNMAIYHLSAKIFSRSHGASIIARAAYRTGNRMRDDETGKVYDYRRKKEVVFHEVSLCANAPEEYRDSKTLWSSVQKAERAANAQLAREIVVALPKEYNREQQLSVLREFIRENFTSKGMICDWAIHEKEGNPHCHMLLTMRPIRKDGTWGSKKTSRVKLDPEGNRIPVIDPKTGEQKKGPRNRLIWQREMTASTDWDRRQTLQAWRTSWANINNRELEKMNVEKISEQSYKDQGIDLEPTIHEGFVARKIEEEGGISERCEFNRSVRYRNLITKSSSYKVHPLTECFC